MLCGDGLFIGLAPAANGFQSVYDAWGTGGGDDDNRYVVFTAVSKRRLNKCANSEISAFCAVQYVANLLVTYRVTQPIAA